MKAILKWIWNSSADPSKVSLTVKSAGAIAIPVVLQIVGISCNLGVLCLSVDSGGLMSVVSAVADIVNAGLLIVGSIGFIYGLLRKLVLTSGKPV